jgi:hypothetical protein
MNSNDLEQFRVNELYLAKQGQTTNQRRTEMTTILSAEEVSKLTRKAIENENARFAGYAKLDPRIGELLDRAQAWEDLEGDESFCANLVWYGSDGLKSFVDQLVGWNRKEGPEELRTSEAYDVVTRVCYRALPDCGHPDLLECGTITVTNKIQ